MSYINKKNSIWTKFVLVFLIAFSVYGCKNITEKPKKLEKAEKNAPIPIFEIWKEVEGSVRIEGETLFFRLFDDGTVEFDREIERPRKLVPQYSDVFIQRRCPSPLSEKVFDQFKLLLIDLANSSPKEEYEPISESLDVGSTFTIIYKTDSNNKKIIVNERNSTLDTSDQNRFPVSLNKLITEVYSTRESFSKIQDEEKKMAN